MEKYFSPRTPSLDRGLTERDYTAHRLVRPSRASKASFVTVAPAFPMVPACPGSRIAVTTAHSRAARGETLIPVSVMTKRRTASIRRKQASLRSSSSPSRRPSAESRLARCFAPPTSPRNLARAAAQKAMTSLRDALRKPLLRKTVRGERELLPATRQPWRSAHDRLSTKNTAGFL